MSLWSYISTYKKISFYQKYCGSILSYIHMTEQFMVKIYSFCSPFLFSAGQQVQTEIAEQLLDGLPWYCVQTFMDPRGWMLMFMLHWLSAHLFRRQTFYLSCEISQHLPNVWFSTKWFPEDKFSSSTSIRSTFVSQQLLDGLPWALWFVQNSKYDHASMLAWIWKALNGLRIRMSSLELVCTWF